MQRLYLILVQYISSFILVVLYLSNRALFHYLYSLIKTRGALRVVQYSDKFMHSIVLYYIHITID